MSDQFGDSPNCLNCGTPLAGQYCGRCGQRASSRSISLWELLRDAFGDLFELDSRLWRTITPLLIRPGRLTRDYLRGRRAHYMPPFRMYLVLSLVFFVAAFFNPRDSLSVLVGSTGNTQQQGHKNTAAESGDPCGKYVDELGSSDVPEFIRQRMTPERGRELCEEIVADHGRQLLRNMLDNVPVALIVLLPVMALALKILYPFSRRYYVEHLLFVVHFHAFFFLALLLTVLLARITSWSHLLEPVNAIAATAVMLYVPVYLYQAMRTVYEQNWYLSLLKFLVLSVTYAFGFSITMLGAFLFAAFSI